MKTKAPVAKPNTGARFSSVLDLVKATAGDAQVQSFEKYLEEAQIVRAMIGFRAAAGLTQEDVASRMECSQSAVSKLEHSSDGDLTLRDIAKYLGATDERLLIAIGKQPSLVERIKESAMCLKHDLDRLADLSVNTDDTKLRNGISSFFGEAWFNLSTIVFDAAQKLPRRHGDEEYRPLTLLGQPMMNRDSEPARECVER